MDSSLGLFSVGSVTFETDFSPFHILVIMGCKYTRNKYITKTKPIALRVHVVQQSVWFTPSQGVYKNYEPEKLRTKYEPGWLIKYEPRKLNLLRLAMIKYEPRKFDLG